MTLKRKEKSSNKCSSIGGLFGRVAMLFVAGLLFQIDKKLAGINSTSGVNTISDSDAPSSRTTVPPPLPHPRKNSLLTAPPSNKQPVLISIPTDLNPPYKSIFQHPYALLLATRKCTATPCSFIVARDLRRNITFSQNGMDHIWIENNNETDAKSMHSLADMVLSSWNSEIDHHVVGKKKRALAVSYHNDNIYPTNQPIQYTHDSTNDGSNPNPKGDPSMISYLTGLETTFHPLEQIVKTLAATTTTTTANHRFPEILLLPITPPSILTKLKTQKHLLPTTFLMWNRIDNIYPTPHDFISTIAKQSPPITTASSLMKRKQRRSLAIVDLAACPQLHPGAVDYIHRLLSNNNNNDHHHHSWSVDFIGTKHPGSCLASQQHPSPNNVIQNGHYARTAATYPFVLFFFELMSPSSTGGGDGIPDLFWHALAWDTVVVVVSRFDYTEYFPCPGSSSSSSSGGGSGGTAYAAKKNPNSNNNSNNNNACGAAGYIWIDPTKTSPDALLERLGALLTGTDDSNDVVVESWDSLMKWRRFISQSISGGGGSSSSSSSSVGGGGDGGFSKEQSLGKQFLGLWDKKGIKSLVCSLCDFVATTAK
ncbi:hypothetical protein BDR26DRAFT_920770 [Obelidium mucronatum]|nr:hypothetical protein BDR26DRAFT_920770 [Obelidium mucronatum]